MIKVLYVFNDASEFACKFYVNEFRELRNAGWQIDVACGLDEEIPFVSNAFPMPWYRNPFRISTFVGIKKVRKLIESYHYDLVYCTSPIGGLIGRLAARQVKTYKPAIIYFCHGFHFYKGSNAMRWLLYYPVEKQLSKYTDLLITINREDFDVSSSKFHAKEYFLSNGIGANIKKYSSTILNEEQKKELKEELKISGFFPVLFYAAEISKLKNQSYLLGVVKELVKQGYNPCLLLPGRDQTNGRFLRQVEKRGLSERVFLLGFRKDCDRILRISDFCTPSSTREGLGLNLVEAMAAKVPVVAVDNRGHRQIIKDGFNGWLLSPKKPNEMAVKISDLIENPQILKNVIASAFLDAQKYDFSEVFMRLFPLYKSTIEKYRKTK